MDADRLRRAAEILGYGFSDTRLLDAALTHPSFAAEHPGVEAYDRLEFLGDAVLGFIIADDIFRSYPDEPEGDLTRRKHSVVSGEALSVVAASLGLSEVLRLGKGADAAGERSRPSVLENALEAVIGAVYADGGLEAATGFVARVLAVDAALPTSAAGDPKSLLQQLTQSRDGVLPAYRIVTVEGPPHQRRFTAEVHVGGDVMGRGQGVSKQSAEKAAAADALKALGGPS